MTDVTFRDDVSVELVKHSASDADVLFAARVSTKGDRAGHGSDFIRYDPLTQANAGLINYLMRERHGSPFEHSTFTFFVQAPIFVFREWHRHRAGWSYNEESGRYTQLKPVFYVPNQQRNLIQIGKPGSYTFVPGTSADWHDVDDTLQASAEDCYENYEHLLDIGIAREVARMTLPVNIYSSMYATCNARSLMHFLGLRTENAEATFKSSPQREIAMAADQLEAIFAEIMPVTYEAWAKNGRVAP